MNDERVHLTAEPLVVGNERLRRGLRALLGEDVPALLLLGDDPALARARTKRRRQRPRERVPDGHMTMAEAAAKLGCSIKTLNGHIESGVVRYVIIGHGSKRPRKMFTDSDLNAFIAAQTRKDAPCPSTASRARRTGTSISKCRGHRFRGSTKTTTRREAKK